VKKRHLLRWIALGLVAAVVVGLLYCNLATWCYDPDVFAWKAWVRIQTHGLGMETEREALLADGWKDAEVEMVRGARLDVIPMSGWDGLWREFNLGLLMLNGGRTVHVVFHTGLDGLLGPIGIYYNPFTGVAVGYDLRE
jgi:hypothetical protein